MLTLLNNGRTVPQCMLVNQKFIGDIMVRAPFQIVKLTIASTVLKHIFGQRKIKAGISLLFFDLFQTLLKKSNELFKVKA